jgi:hypothetical protein
MQLAEAVSGLLTAARSPYPSDFAHFSRFIAASARAGTSFAIQKQMGSEGSDETT